MVAGRHHQVPQRDGERADRLGAVGVGERRVQELQRHRRPAFPRSSRRRRRSRRRSSRGRTRPGPGTGRSSGSEAGHSRSRWYGVRHPPAIRAVQNGCPGMGQSADGPARRSRLGSCPAASQPREPRSTQDARRDSLLACRSSPPCSQSSLASSPPPPMRPCPGPGRQPVRARPRPAARLPHRRLRPRRARHRRLRLRRPRRRPNPPPRPTHAHAHAHAHGEPGADARRPGIGHAPPAAPGRHPRLHLTQVGRRHADRPRVRPEHDVPAHDDRVQPARQAGEDHLGPRRPLEVRLPELAPGRQGITGRGRRGTRRQAHLRLAVLDVRTRLPPPRLGHRMGQRRD